jgi:hypothetical protein
VDCELPPGPDAVDGVLSRLVGHVRSLRWRFFTGLVLSSVRSAVPLHINRSVDNPVPSRWMCCTYINGVSAHVF